VLCLAWFILALNVADAGVYRWIRVGRYQSKVTDDANYGDSAPGRYFDYYYHPGDRDYPFVSPHCRAIGWFVSARDWYDNSGTYYSYMLSGASCCIHSLIVDTMPVPDAEGITIRKYYRYAPVSIIVDGTRLDSSLLAGEEVNPGKIPGTADIMVESRVNTSLGLTLHQKVLAWGQINHDQYHIFDWTFTNTGNTDLDPEIELSDTLRDVYFLRMTYWRQAQGKIAPWESDYGWFPGDSLRIMYAYPGRSRKSTYDDTGSANDPDSVASTAVLRDPAFKGEAYLHVDKSATDKSDDIIQPYVTGYGPWYYDYWEFSLEEKAEGMYSLMSKGFFVHFDMPEVPGTYPGTHHSYPLDQQGHAGYVQDHAWYVFLPGTHAVMGPYTLAPGESFRVVFARVFGSISYEKAWEIGKQFRAGTTADDWEAATLGPLNRTNEHLMPPYVAHFDELIDDDNSMAKDIWVFTGKDSLFRNASAAQWNVRNNYSVPIPPPAPSIEISSFPGRINIKWGNESEAAPDFAGYRIYRTMGRYDSTMRLIADFPGAGIHECDDTTAEHGLAYYYYVAAYDDGVLNDPDWHGKKQVLESGRYLNQTTLAAYTSTAPRQFALYQNHPNPFNPGTTLRFDLQKATDVSLIVYDILGREVAKLVEGYWEPGCHQVQWYGRDIPSGIYIARLMTSESTNSIKMLLLK